MTPDEKKSKNQWCGNPGCDQDMDIHAHDCKGEKVVNQDEKKAEEYPYDKETQEWMAADLGKPSTPEEVFLLWSNKYDRLLDEHAQVLNKIKSIESEAKQKDERIAELEKEKLNLLTCAANQAEEIQRLEKELEAYKDVARRFRKTTPIWRSA